MGKTQAELAFETADLTLFETIGDLAAWTTRRPPRSYYRITAERDAADGGLAGEAWRHFITVLAPWDIRSEKRLLRETLSSLPI